MDTDLVIQAQRGDKGAYAHIATEIADRFLAVARRILSDLDLAEDATQQALVSISRRPWPPVPTVRCWSSWRARFGPR
jgi:DNA-directed RNA polymerase specialized sigma24 family protein